MKTHIMCVCAVAKLRSVSARVRSNASLLQTSKYVKISSKLWTANTQSHDKSITFTHIIALQTGWIMNIPLSLYTTSRLAVLFSEQLCAHGGGREPLSVLLSVSKNRQRGPENISPPCLSLSPPHLPSLHILQKKY